MTIQPISKTLQQHVCLTTYGFLNKAREIYNTEFPIIPVSFDLTGRAAGMYRIHNKRRSIRYNPYIFAKYFDDNMATTVPHEVAHYVADILFGSRNIKPHGTEWRDIMKSFNVKPHVTARYDLTGIPVRQQNRFNYQCDCTTHKITTVRHNKITKGQARYHCRQCGTAIQPAI